MNENTGSVDEVLSVGSSSQNSSNTSIDTAATSDTSLSRGPGNDSAADLSRKAVANHDGPPSNSRPESPVDDHEPEDGAQREDSEGDDQAPSNADPPLEPLEPTDSRLSKLAFSFFGLEGGKWRKALILHTALALIFNGLALGLGIYSAFWGDSAVQDRLSSMQKVLVDECDSSRATAANDTMQQLLALEKWNSFNSWIQSCAAYAKIDVESGRCKGALEAFDRLPPHLPTDSVQDLGKRDLNELAQSLRNATGVKTPLVHRHEAGFTNQLQFQLLASMCLFLGTALCFSLFYPYIFKFVSHLWLGVGKKKRLIPLTEKKETDISIERLSTGINLPSAATQPETGVRRRRVENSRQLDRTNLWYAASQGDVVAVEGFFLRGQCPDINAIDATLGSPLHAAAQSGNDRLVSFLLRKKANPNVTGGRYHSPLQAAAYSTKLASVQLLLRHGAEVDAYGGVFGSPLNAAAERGAFEMVEVLLDQKNADPNRKGGPSTFPLHAAANRGNAQIVRLLLDRGAEVNAEGEHFASALHAAAMEGQRPVVELLLERGAQVDIVSETHGTPLQVACRQGHGWVALLLVEHGANTNVLSQDKQTPLHFAARVGHQPLTKELLARHMDPNARDDNDWTPLHHASLNGHERVVQLLLDHKANVAAGDKFGAHPLFRAAGQHHSKVTTLLLEAGSPPNARDSFGRTALHGPAAGRDVSVQEVLIRKGADINIVGEDKKTPLHEAANVGNYTNVELLLKQEGIKTCLQDNDQKAPLHRALDHVGELENSTAKETDHERIALLLLDAPDLDINARSGLALQEALACNRPNLVAKMLERSASVHLPGGKYGGAVQAAVRSGDLALLALVLARGANVNANGGEFGTALQAAAFFGQVKMVELLLERGANVEGTGGRWGSALHAARMSQGCAKDKEEIVKFLKEDNHAVERPPSPHEKDRWTLTPGGWTWVKPEPWKDTKGMAD